MMDRAPAVLDTLQAPDGDHGAPPSGMPVLHLDGFDGPMDLLLDLAERQRIDLGTVSLIALVEQFVAALASLSGRVPIERQADWLVLATRLVLLRSRLLASTPDDVAEAERDAATELRRLEDLTRIRAVTRWLDERPVLGRDVFARPRGRNRRTETYMALMEACLVVLRGRAGRPEAAPVYRIVPLDFWPVGDALRHMRNLLAHSESLPLEHFLPAPGEVTTSGLQVRAAVASTLLAGLELSRDGEVHLQQAHAFAGIAVTRRCLAEGARVRPP